MIVGEVALQDLHRIVAYLGYGDQLHLAHNFVFIDQEWDAETYATSIADFEKLADRSRLAGLVPRQPRQAAPRQPLQPRRPRPATGASDPRDALRAPRHAVHLPGRGAGPPGRPHPAGPRRRRRRPRPRTSADPVDRRTPEPRLHHRRSVAATRHRSALPQCKNPSSGSALHAESGPAPGADCGQTGRADAGRGGRGRAGVPPRGPARRRQLHGPQSARCRTAASWSSPATRTAQRRAPR